MTRETLRLAVLGDPLDYTRSPELHRAGLAAIGLDGESRALRTPALRLGERLRELAAEGVLGVNLTAPLKQTALVHVGRVTERAGRARSINTIGFDAPERWGDTTDGPGFIDLLRSIGRAPAEQRALFLGAGGAARSLALSMIESGCRRTAVSSRRPEAAKQDWDGIEPVAFHAWGGADEAEALDRATLVVNATPLGDPGGTALLERTPRDAVVIDLRYGPEPTPWILAARRAGLEAWDGLGLLVFQARRSLSLWTGREVPLDPLARAVGWPR